MKREYPPLWRKGDSAGDVDTITESNTYSSLLQQFSFKPEPRPWTSICKSSLVVGQEFTLTCYFLARHRLAHYEEQGRRQYDWNQQVLSLITVPAALLLVAAFSHTQRTRQKTQTRLTDSILLAALLRLLAAALKTLTASYSSDTVHALAITGMVIHVLGCDYSYANGIANTERTHGASSPLSLSSSYTRPPFRGGTMSLNAIFFSTTLLASRLQSNWTVHLFVSSSVTVFAFYPATRHELFAKAPHKASYVLILSTFLLVMATWVLLDSLQEKVAFGGMLLVIGLIVPTWKYYLQRYKIHIHGPWDIAHITKLED